ncbi:helix-turn-helix transcriptional regulator [Lujinxingia vulgaris]|uniref:helix-turn-helix transcriptional regulator n=1 Tax=Lujinxingia vulgaris TaxID=2600176 RepID=UPI001E571BFB|nr:DeoR family transcriptional regulator [Lujinxingia vulgaris]
MTTPDLLNLLSSSRLQIVEFIKRQGTVTVEETAAALGFGETTVRQHFDHLQKKELLTRQSVPDGPGRPTLRYRLTPAGQQLFPSQDAALFGKMLDFLVLQGYPALIDDFFRQMWRERREELSERLEEAGANTLEERLEVVEAFLAEQGFVPEVTVEEDVVTIRECNCPFSEAVRATRLPCRLEAQFLEQALQRDLKRVGYMPEGHPACVYEFQAASSEDDEDLNQV